MADNVESHPRRLWLARALTGGIAATVAAILYPVVRYLQPRPTTSSAATEVVAPYLVSDLHVDAQGKWPPPFNFGGKPCLVILTPTKKVRAFNALCTHLDCTVKFRPEQKDIYCDCHGGVYDLRGRNISGPPPRPLEEYKVTLRGNPGQEEIIVSRNA